MSQIYRQHMTDTNACDGNRSHEFIMSVHKDVTEGWMDGWKRYYIPLQLHWRGDN